ncbi:hypothetical protein SPHINGOT1_80108 [Sphingomonas sp. T1]|uniref:hypothetical protein n=1 Tax=Sphingomonas sp. T1 TaxID=2653172 RepID=UPI0012F3FEEF|nr:hypothetical protein [Sphingomonas sp. T1]VXD07454.1 hypothetical protein SPHINGOT1_80108 [Sphingomonas sp. T1]
MKRKQFSEEQIIGILKEAEAGGVPGGWVEDGAGELAMVSAGLTRGRRRAQKWLRPQEIFVPAAKGR